MTLLRKPSVVILIGALGVAAGEVVAAGFAVELAG